MAKRILFSLTIILFMTPLIASAGTVELPKAGRGYKLSFSEDGELQKGIEWPSPMFVDDEVGTVTGKLQEEDKREILNKVSSLQIPFIEDKGQVKNNSVRYYAKTFGGTLFITRDGEMVYSLPMFDKEKELRAALTGKANPESEVHNPQSKRWVIKEGLVGASLSDVKGEERAITKVSYFERKDPSKWRRNISTYNLVTFGEIYRGIGREG